MTDASDGLLFAGADFSMPVPDAVVANIIPGFDSGSEEALALRYGRMKRKREELTFEFTRDTALLHQYHMMYEEEFKTVQKAKYYHHVEDEHDKRANFLIVRQGNLCIGGGRLSVKTPRQPHLLPIEIDDFRIEDHFPELAHPQKRYGQIGRFCVLPEFRGGRISRLMFAHFYRKAIALNLDMLFGTAPLLAARAYKQNCLAIGLKETKIHSKIKLPEYPDCEEIKFYLVSAVIDKTIEQDKVSVPGDMEMFMREEV